MRPFFRIPKRIERRFQRTVADAVRTATRELEYSSNGPIQGQTVVTLPGRLSRWCDLCGEWRALWGPDVTARSLDQWSEDHRYRFHGILPARALRWHREAGLPVNASALRRPAEGSHSSDRPASSASGRR